MATHMNHSKSATVTKTTVILWFAFAVMLLLIILVLRLGSSDNTTADVTVMAKTATPATTLPSVTPIIATPQPLAAPAVHAEPVAVTTVAVAKVIPNEQRVHAGDDSMFLKDEDGTTPATADTNDDATEAEKNR